MRPPPQYADTLPQTPPSPPMSQSLTSQGGWGEGHRSGGLGERAYVGQGGWGEGHRSGGLGGGE